MTCKYTDKANSTGSVVARYVGTFWIDKHKLDTDAKAGEQQMKT